MRDIENGLENLTISSKGSGWSKKGKKKLRNQRESLPIFKLKDDLRRALYKNQVLLVVGETGSGKSTQITQYLVEAGYAGRGIIGCTQPRRVAAISLATRVAQEYGCRLGEEVGYSVRFKKKISQNTIIKYMTDGLLLRELLTDPKMEKYSCIMLDEAHERTVNTDLLCALLKMVLKERTDLKVVISSATLDVDKFKDYFSQAPVFNIHGRMFPVSILYSPSPCNEYLKTSIETVIQIHTEQPPGDILVFLTGQDEIEEACKKLNERKEQAESNSGIKLIISPVYGALSSEKQMEIFDSTPNGSRKVVFATNIAETSLTIEGIMYVVDSGKVKQSNYKHCKGIDSLLLSQISQAEADQRSGRAGRTGPGIAYRLYTEQFYCEEMESTPVPEIQRTNLSSTYLQMTVLGIEDVTEFEFMDPPSEEARDHALETLKELKALDSEGKITEHGRKMAEYPLDPSLANMLIQSSTLSCSKQILTIVAMLSTQQALFSRPRDQLEEADKAKLKFNQAEGDLFTLLHIYNTWKDKNLSAEWCYDNFLQIQTLYTAQDIRNQLYRIMVSQGLSMKSTVYITTRLQRAIFSGLRMNVATRTHRTAYITSGLETVFIHPSSALYHRNPPSIVFNEVVITSRAFMRDVTVIEPSWLLELPDTDSNCSTSVTITKPAKSSDYDICGKPSKSTVPSAKSTVLSAKPTKFSDLSAKPAKSVGLSAKPTKSAVPSAKSTKTAVPSVKPTKSTVVAAKLTKSAVPSAKSTTPTDLSSKSAKSTGQSSKSTKSTGLSSKSAKSTDLSSKSTKSTGLSSKSTIPNAESTVPKAQPAKTKDVKVKATKISVPVVKLTKIKTAKSPPVRKPVISPLKTDPVRLTDLSKSMKRVKSSKAGSSFVRQN